LILVHFNIYAAQITSHVIGMVFNYFMFSMHVFPGQKPVLWSYILTYAFNYLLSVLCLALIHHVVASSYLAGGITLVTVSFINYFLLKKFVFHRQRAG
jgi:putative flippase GtrA